MAWKIPIPVDVFYPDSGMDALDRAVWFEIIGRCKKDPQVLNLRAGNKCYTVTLQPGQVVFNVSNFADSLGINRKLVKKVIENISIKYEKLDIDGTPFGLIVTVKNFLQIIKLDNDGTTKAQRRNNDRPTNKEEEREREKEGENARARKAPLEGSQEKEQSYVPTTPPIRTTPHGSKVLKDYMGILEWVDPENEIRCAKDLELLEDEIGIEEFNRRFQELLADPWHSKRFNEIKYIYLQMRSYKSKIN